MSFYTRAVRPALFVLDAERAHDLTLAALRHPLLVDTLRWSSGTSTDPRLRHRVFGIDFPNPVGLAAGLDKQGTAVDAWAAIGFGFAEIGTVTPRPQRGNPQPRLFRLPPDRAIINRFGFNSLGADGVAHNLLRAVREGRGWQAREPRFRIGINVGRNKETPNDRAVEDYVRTVERLHSFADYFAVNVSSPNTAGLRDLQDSRTLRALVAAVCRRVREISPGRSIPVLVKVSPDETSESLLRSVDAAVEGGVAGVIATNTTISRPSLASPSRLVSEAGGLSGKPLASVAAVMCRLLFRHLGPSVPVVGVGGIFTADEAYERIRSGAALVQLYTALIYEGPGVVRRVVQGIGDRMRRDGFTQLGEAIGVDAG